MLDIGWSELLVIGVVALIVVGPKDLPIMFRRMGEFTGKARGMAREFSRAMDKAADEAGVKEMQTDLRNIANPKQMGLDAINNAADDLSDWDPESASNSAPDKPSKNTPKPGSETQKLADERAEASSKLHASVSAKTDEAPAPETAPSSASADASDEKPA